MILPIYAFGQPVLKKVAKEVDYEDEDIKELISNMWDTMYNAEGIGLAAPQIGKSYRIFLVDTLQLDKESDETASGIKEVFINAQMLEEFNEEKEYEEGCLSIPDIRGNVTRHSTVKIKFIDAKGKEREETFSGINARVIQHEYDHIEGKLFTDQLKPLKKRRIARKLEKIKKGEIPLSYRMKFI